MPPTSSILAGFQEAQRCLTAFAGDRNQMERLEHAAGELSACLREGGKILTCGNGGSMADAMHFAEELTGRFRADRPALAAVACSDPTHITCTANDYGFDRVFSRWVEALGRPGDCLVLLSTSGNSANLIHAAKAARERGVRVYGLLGKGGGTLAPMCDWNVVVPGETSDRIQELHMLILHCWVEAIEAQMAGSPGGGPRS